MGMFDKIKSAIWGRKDDAAVETASLDASKAAPVTASATATSAAPAAAPAPAASAAPAAAASASGPVDVAAILDAAVKKNGQKLDWRKSIVDLMKALDLDSSLANRKELAADLHYTGDTNDSATMNIWLHKALLKKLAENGGTVPSELTA